MPNIKEKFSKILPKNSFIRSVSVLVGGTATAQLIVIIATPFFSRLYGVEDFGILAVFTSILGMISLVASLRYEIAIPIPEEDEEAVNIVALSLFLTLIITLLTIIASVFFGKQILNAINSPELLPFLWLVSFAVLLTGIYQVFNYWALRSKEFKTITKTKINQSLFSVIAKFVFFKLSVFGLIVSQIVSQSAGTITLARPLIKKEYFPLISIKRIKEVAKKYKEFPLYSTWSALLNSLSIQLVPILFASFFSTTITGLYSMALRLTSLPMSLIGSAIGNVFFSEAPQAHREGRLPELIFKLNNRLLIIAIVPLTILFFWGSNLFSFVLGSQWKDSGLIAQWMTFWLLLQLLWSPLSSISSVLGLQKDALILQVFTSAIRFGPLVFCLLMNYDSMFTIKIFCFSSALDYFFFIVWFFKKAKVKLLKLFKTNIIIIAIPFTVCFAIDYLLRRLF